MCEAHIALGRFGEAVGASSDGVLACSGDALCPELVRLGNTATAAVARCSGGVARNEALAPEVASSSVLSVCAHCGARGAAFSLCEGCHQIPFCKVACRKAGELKHRPVCAQARRANAAVSAEAGLARGAQNAAFINWVAANDSHWVAMQLLAWHLQHTPQKWGAQLHTFGSCL